MWPLTRVVSWIQINMKRNPRVFFKINHNMLLQCEFVISFLWADVFCLSAESCHIKHKSLRQKSPGLTGTIHRKELIQAQDHGLGVQWTWSEELWPQSESCCWLFLWKPSNSQTNLWQKGACVRLVFLLFFHQSNAPPPPSPQYQPAV